MDAAPSKILRELLRDECTLYEVYRRLAASEKDAARRRILVRLAAAEKRHCTLLERATGQPAAPCRGSVLLHFWTARLLGPTFVARQLVHGERHTERLYRSARLPAPFRRIADEEHGHGELLNRFARQVPLSYIGSVVLGLNDALVEFTGALAGFTLALDDTRLVALTGSITGIAAALSMAASEYLSTKSAKAPGKRPLRAAVCTGIAYIVTVAILLLPYLLISEAIAALGVMLLAALAVIALFTAYYAVVRRESFRRRFIEMAALSFGIAGISFLLGYLLERWLGTSV